MLAGTIQLQTGKEGNTVNKLSNKPLYDQVFDQIKDMDTQWSLPHRGATSQ